MLLIIHHFTVVVKSFYKEPSTWVPQATLSVSYYNLTIQLCQALFNKGLFTPLSFSSGYLIVTQPPNFVKYFLTRGFELSPLNLA
jgi:hypothetical protein